MYKVSLYDATWNIFLKWFWIITRSVVSCRSSIFLLKGGGGRRIILFAVGKGPLPIFVLLVISLNFLVETGAPTPYRSAHEYNGVTVYVPLLLHHCYLRYTCKYTVVISVVNIFHLWSSKLQLLFFKSQKYFFYSLCLNYKKNSSFNIILTLIFSSQGQGLTYFFFFYLS